ncbi:MAG: hypothetical protein JEY91_11770 [Spirochaetaceae bacterium]|nr:hypothetical protein [Spirochaetaceae bacterium]
MTGSDEYGIQSIPPRYDEYNSYYIYTSEGYSRAVEEIDAEEGEIAEAELKAEMEQRLNSEEIARLEEMNREDEKRILEEIHLKEELREQQIANPSEYIQEDETPPGTNVDLLA